MKFFIHDTLCAEPKERKSLEEFASLVEGFMTTLKSPVALSKWPELLSLNPTTLKPYITKCNECTKEFDASNTGFSKDGLNLCGNCASKMVGVCSHCGKPSTSYPKYLMTHKYNYLCPECFKNKPSLPTGGSNVLQKPAYGNSAYVQPSFVTGSKVSNTSKRIIPTPAIKNNQPQQPHKPIKKAQSENALDAIFETMKKLVKWITG